MFLMRQLGSKPRTIQFTLETLTALFTIALMEKKKIVKMRNLHKFFEKYKKFQKFDDIYIAQKHVKKPFYANTHGFW